jgi:hypothetical protein
MTIELKEVRAWVRSASGSDRIKTGARKQEAV